jgi:hypothetical protein
MAAEMDKNFRQTEILSKMLSCDHEKSIPEILKEMPNEKIIQSFYTENES